MQKMSFLYIKRLLTFNQDTQNNIQKINIIWYSFF